MSHRFPGGIFQLPLLRLLAIFPRTESIRREAQSGDRERNAWLSLAAGIKLPFVADHELAHRCLLRHSSIADSRALDRLPSGCALQSIQISVTRKPNWLSGKLASPDVWLLMPVFCPEPSRGPDQVLQLECDRPESSEILQIHSQYRSFPSQN